MDEIQAQARLSVEGAQGLEAAHQARMQANLATLAEVSRQMKSVADAAPSLEADDEAPSGIDASGVAAGDEPLELVSPASDEPATGAELAARIGLRNRIRLTPIATDREFTAVFETAGGTTAVADAEPLAKDTDAWTWKDLLASLDGSDGEGEPLDQTLASDLAKMGVDPEALLPKARIDEVAAAIQVGDADGAREVVRTLAPAATRRIARRMFTDDDVRRRAELLIRRYKILSDQAIANDAGAILLSELLCSDGGRIYLLLDTAAGDMI